MKRSVSWEIDEDEELAAERRIHVASPARDALFASIAAKPMRPSLKEKRALQHLVLELDRYEYEDEDDDGDLDVVTMVHDSWLLPPASMPSLRVQAMPSICVKALPVERLASIHPSAAPPSH